jgi:hypothetical protein
MVLAWLFHEKGTRSAFTPDFWTWMLSILRQITLILAVIGPKCLLEVAKKSVRPYMIDVVADKTEWWMIFQSMLQLQFCCSEIHCDPLNISLADQSSNGLPQSLLHMSGFSFFFLSPWNNMMCFISVQNLF